MKASKAKITDEMKEKLTQEQYNVCFLKGTEPPFTGKYTHNKAPGSYRCAVCGTELFSSESKFDSGTGWPSFDRAEENERIEYTDDDTYGMRRTEVTCANCGSHLGHVFDDGPTATGKRYCINSLSLEFVPEAKPVPK